jgi:hypothetical protein
MLALLLDQILLSTKLRTNDVFVLRPVPNREVAAVSDVERAVTEIDLFLKEARTHTLFSLVFASARALPVVHAA